MIRSVNLSIRNESQSINQFLNKFKLDKINYIGIYDRKMTFQFNNQFLEGEELFIQNDHFIPTPASTPSLAPTHRKNSEFLRECFPIWKFSKKFNPVDTTTEFLKFYKIPILIVKNRDLKNAASATSLYSKSMVNTRLDYTVFYDLKNPKN